MSKFNAKLARRKLDKWSAKRESKKLDAFCRQIVFARDGNKCRRCGKDKDHAALHWAHTITRASKAVRWNLKNSQVLCYYCHFRWAHEYPLQFAAWVRSEIGDEATDALIRASSTSRPLDPIYVQTVWQYLSDEAQKYGVKLP